MLRFYIAGLFLWLVLLPTSAIVARAASAPTVTTLSTNSNSIGRYQKLEITFQISRSFSTDSMLPYYFYDPADSVGVNGISIDAHFTAPSGANLTVPAFYYQDFTRSGTTTEVMTPSSNYAWKVRFAPEEIGQYNYYISIQDANGTSRYPATGSLTFAAIPSLPKGFVRVSPIDSRFMAYSNGASFIPIASGHQWWLCCGARSFEYATTFANFAQNGINLVRIWDQNDGYSLTVEGHFDAYSYPGDYTPSDAMIPTLPKGTQMNQRGNYEEDKIIESAEQNGVLIQLCSHGDVYWQWDASVYTDSWNTNPVTFSNTAHINYWKRNFRYRVARWGYSTSILAWETWNEHGNIPVNSDIYNFYQTYGQYQQSIDPYHHLRTTSQGSQSFSPGLWSSSAFDLANYHDYLMSNRYSANLVNDEANFVSRFAWCLGTRATYCSGLGVSDGSAWLGNAKPWVWGEFDVGTTNWNEVNPNAKSGEGRLRFLHNSTWAGLFSPMGTSPLDWYYNQEDTATTTASYADRKITSAFFSTIDYAGARFVYLTTPSDTPTGYAGETVSASNSQARVYAMRRNDQTAAFLWVQNRNYTWANFASVPSPIASTIMIGGLINGAAYNVSQWNTHTGAMINAATQTPSTGSLTLNVANLTNDVAFKIERASGIGSSFIHIFLPLVIR